MRSWQRRGKKRRQTKEKQPYKTKHRNLKIEQQ